MAEAIEPLPKGSEAAVAEMGVYYRREDSPGMFLRVLIGLIDSVAAAAIVLGLMELLTVFAPRTTPLLATVLIVLPAWAYMVVLKRTRVGTLGYLLFGVRVVDLKGNPPGFVRLTLRLLVACGLNPFLDLVYLTSDTSRQSLRDKMGGTYVVKKRAAVEGRGELVYANLFFMNMALVYREVKRPR